MSPDVDLERLNEIPDPLVAPAPLPPPPELPASPTRAERLRSRLGAAGAGVVVAVGLATALGLRADASARGVWLATAGVLVAAAVAFVGASRASGRAWAPWLLGSLAAFGVGAALHVGSAKPASAPRAALVCLVASLALAAAPLGLLAFAFRHAFATHARRRSLALGVTAGAIAAGAMELHCAVGSTAHMVLGHGSALVLAGLVGLGLARFTRA